MSSSRAAESRNEDSNASDYEVSTYDKQPTTNTSKQMRIHMPNCAKACDRHGISNPQLQQLCVMLISLLHKIPLK